MAAITESSAGKVGVGVLALLILGAAADVVGLVSFSTGKSGPELAGSISGASATPSDSIVPQDSASASASGGALTATAQPSMSASSPGPPAGVQPQAADVVDSSSNVDYPTTASIAGEEFQSAATFTCDTVCDPVKGVIIFRVPEGAQRFRVLAGVLDDAPEAQTGFFEIFVDNVRVWQGKASLNAPVNAVVPSANAVQVKLVAFRKGTVGGSPAKNALAGANAAGGVSNYYPSLGWGDPTFEWG